MKKILAALIVSVALPAAACQAGDHCSSFLSCGSSCGHRCLGPWYSYWPLEAHFQTPAPTGYPYWPSPMGMGGMQPQLPAYGHHHGGAPQAMPMLPGMHQQMGYFQQAPSYWYGN